MQDYVLGEGISKEENELNNLAMFISCDDPHSFEEAIVEDEWRKVMNCEMESIEKNETCQLTTLPVGARKIDI